MCGCFLINDRDPVMRRLFQQLRGRPHAELVRGGEIFPGGVAAALLLEGGKLAPRPMLWGFPKWDGKGVIFNARSETVAQKAMFRRAFLANPAVIPSSGFFEWKRPPQGGKKEKYRFNLPGREQVFLAGFWNRFEEQEGRLADRLVVLTAPANPSMAAYHGRMPVILRPGELERWLRGSSQGLMLKAPLPEVAASPCF